MSRINSEKSGFEKNKDLFRYGLFYDFHTMPACPDVGLNFDADKLVKHALACKADYLVFPARCNLGMAYYKTKTGIIHPALNYDLLGKLAEACKGKVIFFAYINVGISHEEALLHRDWCVLTPDGYTYRPDRLDSFFRTMCYNSGYREHLLEMIREIVVNYPVRGLFLDCMSVPPCIGHECINEIKSLGMDWRDMGQLRKYAEFSKLRMAKLIAETARSAKPDIFLYFNGINFEDQLELSTHLEFECLPTGGWGYEELPVFARYLRTLKKTVINQTGRFHRSWGDFGGIRPEAALEYDCLYGLANGMGVAVGDHFHPRGDINEDVFAMVKKVYNKLQKLEPWLAAAVPITDIAVMAPESALKTDLHYSDEGHKLHKQALQGITRLLCELKMQFDIVSDISNLKNYKVLILPDYCLLSKKDREKIIRYLKRGGAVISTGWSGLNEGEADSFPPEWGIKLKGESPFCPAYFSPGLPLAENMPSMPVSLYEKGTLVAPLAGTEILAHIIAPYYNRHWDGEHGFVYLPPDKATKEALITRKGNVIHAAYPLGMIYSRHAYAVIRQLFANMLQLLLPEPLLKTDNAPSFARITVSSQGDRKLVHILAYIPERRGADMDIIEEPVEISNLKIKLKLNGRKLKQVYLAPNQECLPYEINGIYAEVTIPHLCGYALVVFEEK
ncbi:MAG: beta-galactosidase trimerization domain-containing protein [Victivallaceae bacterium]|nr:beta-galactosidase trimerization domain-containing protein [Victivallaceae bacterium]